MRICSGVRSGHAARPVRPRGARPGLLGLHAQAARADRALAVGGGAGYGCILIVIELADWAVLAAYLARKTRTHSRLLRTDALTDSVQSEHRETIAKLS